MAVEVEGVPEEGFVGKAEDEEVGVGYAAEDGGDGFDLGSGETVGGVGV